MNLTSGTNH
jgi:hypothetical protein